MERVPGKRPSDVDQAFRELFEREFDWVCFTLQRLGVRAADLEDVAQEVFVAVHARLPECDRELPMRPWLTAFVHRAAANYRRLARHRETPSDAPDALLEGPAREAARREEADEARRLVMRVLEELPFDLRAVLVLHDMDGLTAREIAEVIERPENTVYDRLRLARKRFTATARRLHPREEVR